MSNFPELKIKWVKQSIYPLNCKEKAFLVNQLGLLQNRFRDIGFSLFKLNWSQCEDCTKDCDSCKYQDQGLEANFSVYFQNQRFKNRLNPSQCVSYRFEIFTNAYDTFDIQVLISGTFGGSHENVYVADVGGITFESCKDYPRLKSYNDSEHPIVISMAEANMLRELNIGKIKSFTPGVYDNAKDVLLSLVNNHIDEVFNLFIRALQTGAIDASNCPNFVPA